MSSLNFRIWLSLFLTFSICYVAIRTFSPFELDWIVKSIPIFLLIFLCLKSLSGLTKKLMIIGLSFSVSGDILLSQQGMFIPGLGAFLMAQITYTVYFLRQFKFSFRGVIWAAVVIGYLSISAFFILPSTGDLLVAVVLYMLAISAMAISAGFRQSKDFLLIALGAFIFMISDTVIALNKFVVEFNAAGSIIMITYYTAQFMIVLGVIRHQGLKLNTD